MDSGSPVAGKHPDPFDGVEPASDVRVQKGEQLGASDVEVGLGLADASWCLIEVNYISPFQRSSALYLQRHQGHRLLLCRGYPENP